jgi:hypothetical protein
MEIRAGLIRDKPGIYNGLLRSWSTKGQLAVCYNSGGKLFVKICVVKEIRKDNDATTVCLASPDDIKNETTVALDHIESIYPIRAYIP